MINKILFTMFIWLINFHMWTVDGSKNIQTIFNFSPSIGLHLSRNCWNSILNLAPQSGYVRGRYTINNVSYITPKGKDHQRDIRWEREAHQSNDWENFHWKTLLHWNANAVMPLIVGKLSMADSLPIAALPSKILLHGSGWIRSVKLQEALHIF